MSVYGIVCQARAGAAESSWRAIVTQRRKEGRRNGAEESRFAVIGGLGCCTKDLGSSPASRWLGRRIRN